ncbi:adenine glycosylase [Shewanella sp. D64]|uniref:baseplate complex protein n=1 Tax=unclassified Shewanella TaxID=196818 RepID=UPI0022BA49F0|nr:MULTISPECIES: adenine glycosylase [unclassified Shewanella]MEC4728857.1 adenine glycosylase [Shewanella sp. D64]MEC4740731.1 adenine glycosylase [Shewanella sp. E94]WBJ95310.1 adenine glycosylase [Shewanella sp. MTB7]
MTLQLNNQLVPGEELKVAIKMSFGDSDLSGQGSGTESAETGTKAKELTVSLVVPFANAEWLTRITTLAESTDATTGTRQVYRIGYDAARAIKLYQAKFVGELNVTELDDTQGWMVTFNMREQLSVPERKAQREPIKAAKQQGGGDSIVAVNSDDIPPNTELTGFASVLKYIDEALKSSEVIDTPSEEVVA